jgi:dynein assembly factor 2
MRALRNSNYRTRSVVIVYSRYTTVEFIYLIDDAPSPSVPRPIRHSQLPCMQECDKFAKAFKDPEFIKMFEEYAREVSDPKVKAETDAYLRQLEMEGRIEEVYGKGAQLIMPEPSFVLKTYNKADGTKVFINVCSSDKIDKASLKEATSADGRKGKHLDMPLCLGPKKEGKDKHGSPCLVWDFVVHPETLVMASSTPPIREAMVVNAMEKIESSNKGISLDRKHTSPKTHGNYKATEDCPQPHSLALRGEGSTVDGRVKPLDTTQKAPSPSPSPSAQAKQEPSSTSRSSFAFPSKPKSKPAPSIIDDPAHPGYVHEGGETTPKWELVHRGQVDLGEAWGDAGRAIALNTTHPKELVLRVVLPGVTSASGVDLDLSRSQVTLVVDKKYKLTASLPFPVDSDRGRAKFDKAKSQLEVVVPVVPPPLPPRASSNIAVAQDQPPLVEFLGAPAEEVASPAAQEDPSSQVEEGATASEVKEAIKEEALTENQRRWMEMHSSQAKPAELKGEAQEEARANEVVSPPHAPLPAIKPRLQALADELD